MSYDVGLGIIKVIHEFDLNKTSAMLILCAFSQCVYLILL